MLSLQFIVKQMVVYRWVTQREQQQDRGRARCFDFLQNFPQVFFLRRYQQEVLRATPNAAVGQRENCCRYGVMSQSSGSWRDGGIIPWRAGTLRPPLPILQRRAFRGHFAPHPGCPLRQRCRCLVLLKTKQEESNNTAINCSSSPCLRHTSLVHTARLRHYNPHLASQRARSISFRPPTHPRRDLPVSRQGSSA